MRNSKPDQRPSRRGPTPETLDLLFSGQNQNVGGSQDSPPSSQVLRKFDNHPSLNNLDALFDNDHYLEISRKEIIDQLEKLELNKISFIELSPFMLEIFERVQSIISTSREPILPLALENPPSQADISETWEKRDRSRKEAPTEFISRVYARWLGKGFNKSHLRKLDPKLYQALANWLSKPENTAPENFDLLPGRVKHRDVDISAEEQLIWKKVEAARKRTK